MTLFLAAYSIGGMANALTFYLIKDWTYVLIFYYFLGIILFGIPFFLWVESPPIELISHNKDPTKAYEGFIRMAEANGVTDHGITLEEITNIHENYH